MGPPRPLGILRIATVYPVSHPLTYTLACLCPLEGKDRVIERHIVCEVCYIIYLRLPVRIVLDTIERHVEEPKCLSPA
jgi:hypothetical protein